MNDDTHQPDPLTAVVVKTMAVMCVRNTKLEDLHAGIAPITRTGDYSDVNVVDADGRSISWNEVSHFDDDTMRDLMRQVVDRLYTFDAKSSDPRFVALMDRWSHVVAHWDEPRLDPILLHEMDRIRGTND